MSMNFHERFGNWRHSRGGGTGARCSTGGSIASSGANLIFKSVSNSYRVLQYVVHVEAACTILTDCVLP